MPELPSLAINAAGGRTLLAFSKDGKRLFAGGADYNLRVQDLAKLDDEPKSVDGIDESVTALATCADTLLVGFTDSSVKSYTANTIETTFTGNFASTGSEVVQCIAIDAEGKKVAVGSQDTELRIIELENPTSIFTLEGHTGGVRKVSWHPRRQVLAASDAGGVLHIWDLTSDKHTCKKLDGFIPGVRMPIDLDKNEDIPLPEPSEFLHDCTAIWHPSGKYLVVATRSHDVVTISFPDLKKEDTFVDTNIVGATTALAFSPNGLYLATAAEGTVYIWNADSRQVVTKYEHTDGGDIIQLSWCPTKNFLAWTNDKGFLTEWNDAVPTALPSPISSVRTSDTEDIDDQNALDDFADDDNDDFGMQWDEIAAGVTKGNDDVEEELASFRPQAHYSSVKTTKPQPAFQPGATPWVDSDRTKRYLATNALGVIELITPKMDEDSTRYIVNVEFWNTSTRRGMNFASALKYEMGYLGERGAVFACAPEGEHSAQVLFKPYGAWGNQSDWTYDLKDSNVSVLGVAAGSPSPSGSVRESRDGDLQGFGNVVVATDEGDLTFLSGTGRERRIMALAGDFISMVASAEWVFVVYRAGSTTAEGGQNLSYMMIDFEDFAVRQRDYLPIPNSQTLKWIGLTGDGAPAMYDSTGRLHVLTKFRVPHHASWARVLDTNTLARREGKDESYWPLGLEGNNFLCFILKGQNQYPGVQRPLPQELTLELPFRQAEAKDEELEREIFMRDMALDALDDDLTTEEIMQQEKAMDKIIVQLIQAACKVDNIPRAIELTKMLHATNALDAAAKIAKFYQAAGFEEKVLKLKHIREESDERLEIAREKRRQWQRANAPPRRLPDKEDYTSFERPTQKAFQDFGSPPRVARPGLQKAQPKVEKSRYSRQEDELDFADVGSPNGKRKRDLDVDVDVDDNPFSSSQAMPAPPKPKLGGNPFAKKAKRDDNKVLQKTESFFDKVDAAEAGTKPKRNLKGLGKAASSISAQKQTTLFGMMKKKAPTPPAPSQEDNDTQTTELTEATQREPSPDWDESLMESESTQVV
ncbi:hypothetical protein CYLTODRAFT_488848 [Cylindrobasidium torrendii FP15055 ss-10]|uniref:Uncharacterized protein n=1 Tax=Cylindrobasidium torrendii FP15055 ss-10 TaxID=1314674 RepID=A0A0D7BHA0_9AGAR|nr:hypothetical protein CYLTODRAFT_488848 [Cylindrobasidium torrendii FP15055 ss-10]